MSNVKSSKSAPAPAVEAPAVEAQAPEAPSGALGVQALADAVGASPKDVRRWLRAQTRATLGRAGAADVLPGKGGRYAFTAEDVSALAGAYGASRGAKGTRAPASAILSALAPSAPAE